MTDFRFGGRYTYCTVAQLRRELDKLQPNDELLPNDVGNLAIMRPDPRGDRGPQSDPSLRFRYVGWIELASGDPNGRGEEPGALIEWTEEAA